MFEPLFNKMFVIHTIIFPREYTNIHTLASSKTIHKHPNSSIIHNTFNKHTIIHTIASSKIIHKQPYISIIQNTPKNYLATFNSTQRDWECLSNFLVKFWSCIQQLPQKNAQTSIHQHHPEQYTNISIQQQHPKYVPILFSYF